MELVRGGRIAPIEGLRGIAIAVVVWFHVWQISWQSTAIPLLGVSLQPLAECGFLGVELFFFISGFVLMIPPARARLAGAAAPTLRHFFVRRALKIVPSYALCIAVLLALRYQTYATPADGVRDVVLHLLFVHDWFAVSSSSIDGVMWSLGVEVQFYVLFPLLAYAFVRRPLTTAAAMVVVANGFRVWCAIAGRAQYGQLLQQLPAYLDLFAAGMLAAFAFVAIATHRPALARRAWPFTLLALAGFAALWLIASDCFVHRYDAAWPLDWDVRWRSLAALACFATALGALFAVRAFQRVLANPALLFLAAISYNLYLWHQPLARGLRALHVPPYATADPHDDPSWQLAFAFVAVPAAVALAALLTYAFERPIMRLGRRTGAKAAPATAPPSRVYDAPG